MAFIQTQPGKRSLLKMCGASSSRWRAKSRRANSCNPKGSIRTDYNQFFVNMTMAYLSVSDDRANFSHIFSKPEDFYGAGPYTYWFAALLILILGPGKFAVDTLLRRIFSSTSERAHTLA